MGIYAETRITIECKDEKSAIEVKNKIENLRETKEGDANYDFDDLEINDNGVSLFKTSGRIQNLEYQCEVLWAEIRGIKGVINLEAPFMVEGNGKSFSNEEDN